jgi:hypothetical protein
MNRKMASSAVIVEEEKHQVRQYQIPVLVIGNSEDQMSVGIVFAVVDLIT